jgi:hypothetical protein
LYYSGDTGTNRGTSLRHPWDACHRAQIRSDVLHQAAEDLVNNEAQVERYDLLYRNMMPEGSPNVESDVLEMRVIAAVPVVPVVAGAVDVVADMFEMKSVAKEHQQQCHKVQDR